VIAVRRLLIPAATAVAVIVALALAANHRDKESPDAFPRSTAVPHTAQRAEPAQDPVAAAARFLTSLTPPVLLDGERRRSLLDRWADPATRDSLERTYDAEADRVRATYGGAPLVSRSALLGYHVVRRSASELDVAIWAVGVAAGRTGTGASGWSTVTVGVRRRGVAWHVTSVRVSSGPDPGESTQALAHAASTFHPFSHAR
jgi:hypothetical protein